MPPIPGAPHANGKDTKIAILEHALRLFAESGYAGTSIRDIAASVGLTSATLYSHYPSKAHILAEVVNLGHAEQVRAVRAELLSCGPDPREQILAYIRGHVETHATFSMLCIVANAELHMLPDELAQSALTTREFSEQLLVDIVQRGVKQGVFKIPDIWLATAAIGGMGLRVAYWYTQDRYQDISTISETYGAFALRILGIPDDPRPTDTNIGGANDAD